MSKFTPFIFTIFVIIKLTTTQAPPRLQIPGAVLVGQPKPIQFRQQRLLNSDGGPPPLRFRTRPLPSLPPQPPIRPVIEENDEQITATTAGTTTAFDDEVNKLGLSVLQQAIRDANDQQDDIQSTKPSPLPFRPEKPLPLLRENLREKQIPVLRQEISRPRPIPTEEPLIVRQQVRQRPIPTDEPQQVLRQPPVRQYSARQQQVNTQTAAPPPAFRPQPRPAPPPPRQPSQYLDEDGHRSRTRKPPVQILRKYLTENPDGSITWGYENEDGTFKEETMGIDCITRGKYGYVDPDGVRREYSYETGNKCDEPQEEELQPQGRQPQQQLQPKKAQLRPASIQYTNN